MNPRACACAAAGVLAAAGLHDVPIGVIAGDDLLGRLDEIQAAGCRLENLDTGRPLAELTSPVVSANAYLGARPIAQALAGGARIVITGRVADASLTVGPAMHEFGWAWDDWNRLAGASVAGHLIECGAQVTGGLYRHWQLLDLANVGYPIAELMLTTARRRSRNPRERAARLIATRSPSNSSTKSAIRPIISRPTSMSISQPSRSPTPARIA